MLLAIGTMLERRFNLEVKDNLGIVKKSFYFTEITKRFPTPIHSVQKVRFKLKSGVKLSPQIANSIMFREDGSIFRLDTNITDNISV